jgi:hypothetical protein
MIYETILKCVDDLSTRWSDLNDGLLTLSGALASDPDPALRATQPIISGVGGWVTQINVPPPVPPVLPPPAPGIIQTIASQRPNLTGPTITGFPPIASVLSTAQNNIFAPSNFLYLTINGVASGLLPQWLASASGETVAAATVVQSRLEDLGALIAIALQEIIELSDISNTGARANLGRISSSVDDISTYPVFTQDLSYGSGPMPSGGGAGGTSTAPLTQIAAKAISAVLGRRPRLADPKSFVAALNGSFICKDVEGHTECIWTERAPGGLTEMGGSITGAQASIYVRAKEASDATLPLLDGLLALRMDADPQETEAVRSIVKNEFIELVNEFGVEGGPRVQRVDDLFELLIGYLPGTAITIPPAPPTARGDFTVTVPGRGGLISYLVNTDLLLAFGGGEVGRLGDGFGFTRDQVNTIEEERNLTNYLVLRDYIRSLFTSWQEFRNSFLGGVENYLGTQLILLQRSLSVVAESVDETTFAMDSVFLGPAERQTVRIDLPTTVAPGPMYVDELLSWVQNFATAEGTRIVEEGGKLGVRSIVPTLQLLQRLVQNAVGRIRHPGARHPRVQRTLTELASQLNEAARLAGTIR